MDSLSSKSAKNTTSASGKPIICFVTLDAISRISAESQSLTKSGSINLHHVSAGKCLNVRKEKSASEDHVITMVSTDMVTRNFIIAAMFSLMLHCIQTRTKMAM